MTALASGEAAGAIHSPPEQFECAREAWANVLPAEPAPRISWVCTPASRFEWCIGDGLTATLFVPGAGYGYSFEALRRARQLLELLGHKDPFHLYVPTEVGPCLMLSTHELNPRTAAVVAPLLDPTRGPTTSGPDFATRSNLPKGIIADESCVVGVIRIPREFLETRLRGPGSRWSVSA